MNNLEFLMLRKELKDVVVDVYADVFAGSPWFEQYRCKDCGESFSNEINSKDKIKEDFVSCNYDVCDRNSLNLVSFYKGTYFDKKVGELVSKLGEKIFLDSLNQEGFVGLLAKFNSEPIGFTWGYKVPNFNTPSVMFNGVNDSFKNLGYDPDSIFYAAEVGVVSKYQKKGIGSLLSSKRLEIARDSGYKFVSLRTKNPKLLSVYEKLFGEGSGITLFEDPDPAKDSSVKWYMWSFDDFKGLK